MEEKNIYTVLGYLLTQNPYINGIDRVILDFQKNADLVLFDLCHYLKELKLPLELVIDLIMQDTICGCSHKDGNSDFDNLEIDFGTGRISWWCEPDGFRAYFDEIHKTWEPRKYSEKLPKEFQKLARKLEKAWNVCLEEELKNK